MAIMEESERQGQWLFRWRSYIPLPLLGLAVFEMRHARPLFDSRELDLAWQGFCAGVALLGLLVRALAVGFAPAGTSGRNTTGQMAEALNTTGMYATCRHPIYFGNFLMSLGVMMLPRSAWLAAVCVLAFVIYYERIMLAEESFLRKKFGAPYDDWASRTPAVVPRPWRWTRPSVGFSLRTVIKREYHGLFGLILCFALLATAGDYFREKSLRVDTMWQGILAGGAAFYLVTRFLKKLTRVLDVPGR